MESSWDRKADINVRECEAGMIMASRPFYDFGSKVVGYYIMCVQRIWTTLAGESPVTVIASEPCSYCFNFLFSS